MPPQLDTRQRLLSTLAREGPLDYSRRSQVNLTGRTSDNLLESYPGIVTVSEKKLQWGPGAGMVVAVSISRERMRLALMDANGEILRDEDGRLRAAYRTGGTVKRTGHGTPNKSETLKLFKQRLNGLVDEIMKPGDFPLGAVVAWPAPIDPKTGQPTYYESSSKAFHRLRPDQELALAIERCCKVKPKVVLVNDSNAELRGEQHYGVVRELAEQERHPDGSLGKPDALLVKVGAGLGAAILMDGAVLVGSRGVIGELGHATYDKAMLPNETLADHAVPCSCRRGTEHLECIVSIRALLERFFRNEPGSYQQLIDDHLAGKIYDGEITAALEEIGIILGRAVRGTAVMLDPDRIVLASLPLSDDMRNGMSGELSARGLYGLAERVVHGTPDDDDGISILLKGAGRCAIERFIFPEIRKRLKIPAREPAKIA